MEQLKLFSSHFPTNFHLNQNVRGQYYSWSHNPYRDKQPLSPSALGRSSPIPHKRGYLTKNMGFCHGILYNLPLILVILMWFILMDWSDTENMTSWDGVVYLAYLVSKYGRVTRKGLTGMKNFLLSKDGWSIFNLRFGWCIPLRDPRYLYLK